MIADKADKAWGPKVTTRQNPENKCLTEKGGFCLGGKTLRSQEESQAPFAPS